MARLIGKPYELVEFHLWYLKTKGWVERLDTGLLAISVAGVDQVEQSRLRLREDRLLTADGFTPEDADGRSMPSGKADLLVFPKGTDFKQ